jgi:hypothetical protein
MRMSRRRKERRQKEDHTGMAFGISGIFACAVIALVEDIFYFATDETLWNTLRFHPVSIFVGTLVFLGLLYCLQRMNDPERALQYLEPYWPLLGFSGLNLALKLNAAWLLLVAVACIVWSVAQVRRLRYHRPVTRRVSLFR